MHQRYVLALLIAMLSVFMFHGGGAVRAEDSTRIPPYDFGCLISYRLCVPWEEARQGTLRGLRAPGVTVTYSIPPFPALTTYEHTTETGIYVDLAESSSVSLSAILRRADSDVPIPKGELQACIGGVTPEGFRSRGVGCQPLSSADDPIELATDFGGKGFEAGRWAFFVHLGDNSSEWLQFGAAEVLVDSISVQTTTFVEPSPTGSESPSPSPSPTESESPSPSPSPSRPGKRPKG